MRVVRDLLRGLDGLALSFEATEGAGRLRGQPDVPHHGDPRAHDRPRSLNRRSATLELDRVDPGLPHETLRVLYCVLVGALIRAEGHVADQKRRAHAAPDGSGHRDHLVHPDGRRGVITEHDHRGRVPDQDDVDSSFFSHEPGGVVVGGDHDDGLTIRLHLGDTRERHRRSVGLVWL